MSDAIIRVENLSKRYTINHQTGGSYRKFSDALIHSAKAPLRWLRPQSPGHLPEHSQESFWALKDVNFEIKQGEVVGIIGRNGAGKSTLLKILSRITEPTSGRITLKGRVASLLEVGTGFHPELTGRENIYLNGAILGMTKVEIRSKFDEIVAFAEIEKFLDTPVKRYSSGMYVRLAFAVAAHLDPEILIVDEVLAVGDAQFQKKCLGKMQDVAAGGRTVLFVSHNLSVVQELCTKAILLKSGTVAMEGKPAAIASAYLLSGAPQGPEIDLATSKRAGTPKQGCRIEKATAAGENAQRGFFFDFNERIRFSVTVSASQDLGEAELGIALLTPGRFEIASSLSSHSLPKSTLPKGEHVFHICYNDLRLTPGIYVADLGIKSDRGIEDRITDAFEFEILAQEEAVTASTHVCSGVVIPSVTFNLVKK